MLGLYVLFPRYLTVYVPLTIDVFAIFILATPSSISPV